MPSLRQITENATRPAATELRNRQIKCGLTVMEQTPASRFRPTAHHYRFSITGNSLIVAWRGSRQPRRPVNIIPVMLHVVLGARRSAGAVARRHGSVRGCATPVSVNGARRPGRLVAQTTRHVTGRRHRLSTLCRMDCVAPGARFDLSFVGEDGGARREPLPLCWSVPFERTLSARSSASYKGRMNFAGFRWTAPTCRHVGFESWLGRDNAMLLDFDSQVVGLSSQPFCCSGGTAGVSGAIPRTTSPGTRTARGWLTPLATPSP